MVFGVDSSCEKSPGLRHMLSVLNLHVVLEIATNFDSKLIANLVPAFDEANPKRSSERHLLEASRGRARKAHGLCARGVSHQNRCY